MTNSCGNRVLYELILKKNKKLSGALPYDGFGMALIS